MNQKPNHYSKTLLINAGSGLLWVSWGLIAWKVNILVALASVYLAPPLLCRLITALFGKSEVHNQLDSRGYLVWWATMQLQIPFLRIPFLEECLRLIPGAYSGWLRLWGASIGRYVYWGPQVRIMDRNLLEIGDHVIVGYGAGFTSHHFNYSEAGLLELIVASPVVESHAILGGLSGLTPGARVCTRELLPSTMGLAPFYTWKNGRRWARGKLSPELIPAQDASEKIGQHRSILEPTV